MLERDLKNRDGYSPHEMSSKFHLLKQQITTDSSF